MLRVSVRKIKALPVKEERVMQVGKGRWNLTCFVYEVYAINSKIFSLGDVLFLGVILDWDKYIGLWQTFSGGLSNLELSCIWVNMGIISENEINMTLGGSEYNSVFFIVFLPMTQSE